MNPISKRLTCKKRDKMFSADTTLNKLFLRKSERLNSKVGTL